LLDIDNNFDQTSTHKSVTTCINQHEQKKNLQSILRKSKSDVTKQQISFDTSTLKSEEKNNKNNSKRIFEDLNNDSNKYLFYNRPVDITEQEYKK
jgi:hypothetical protein